MLSGEETITKEKQRPEKVGEIFVTLRLCGERSPEQLEINIQHSTFPAHHSNISPICWPSVSGSNGLAMTPRTPRDSKRRRSAACTFAVRKITGIDLVELSLC